MAIKNLIQGVLLIFVPISVAADVLHWGEDAVFVTSILAIIPLSIWLAKATEKVAVVTGPSLGGLVNALFGNATALIIALMALRQGLVDIVEASITGSILSALLLLLGLAMLTGGLRYKEQEFKPILVKVNGSSMTLAAIAIALPTMVIDTSNIVDASAIRNLSLIVSVILIAVYGLTLLFSLKTHSYLYDVGLADEEMDGIAAFSESEASQKRNWSKLGVWIAVLLVSTLAVAFESDLFVGVISSQIERFGLTPLFTGVIVLPLISDVAGLVTVVRLALKNQMDLTVATATGDSLLIALFVAPVLVLVGQAMGQPIDLNFNTFEVIALAIAVAITNLISFGGRSNWLDGTLLLATYLILGVAFYYHPA
ncbi:MULTISPECIES: calcium/proton exchanger [unclassified Coleofasciculus]|uniref:calcium/proton exchanger n=1 Tax=unclassified Coleofasciculus TaxID=2692782 RepID=UPI001880211C|nr:MULTISPECIES: calcium/proton exchanger [unclassified Coleofasciculus]MBE9126060.1 calcium/proton exchanger [Coleofasciculus sp. LEGE 07081]MBE9149473.1 calcium/proton exchanger [Coleofasciculus sp. LEGE 07092]